MKKNYFWIDFLKAISAFAVILLHVSVPLQLDFSNEGRWEVGMIYNSISRFCVPVFVMISGVLLLSKTEELSVFLKKRFSRLLFPFIFWSLIYLLININYGLNTKEIILFSVKQLRSGTQYHLWYIYMLIGLYLFIPILSRWSVNATKKEMAYFLGICLFLLLLDLPIFEKLFTRIDFRYFSGYIGYLVLGTFLHRYYNLKSRWIGFLLFLLGIGSTLFLTYYFSVKTNIFVTTYYNFLSLNVAIASAGLFLWCKDMVTENEYFKNAVGYVSRYSYGIYLSHVFIIIVFEKIGFTYLLFEPWIGVPAITTICFIFSLLLTVFLSKIPLIGKYISG